MSHVQAGCMSQGCGLTAMPALGGAAHSSRGGRPIPCLSFPTTLQEQGLSPLSRGCGREGTGMGWCQDQAPVQPPCACTPHPSEWVPPCRGGGQVSLEVSGPVPPGVGGRQRRRSQAASAALLQTPTMPDYSLVATAPCGWRLGTVNPGQLRGWGPPHPLLHPERCQPGTCCGPGVVSPSTACGMPHVCRLRVGDEWAWPWGTSPKPPSLSLQGKAGLVPALAGGTCHEAESGRCLKLPEGAGWGGGI